MAILLLCQCSQGDFAKGGQNEKAGGVDLKTPNPTPQVADTNQPIARAVYQIKVKANTGMELCVGLITVFLSTSFNLNPTGKIKCIMFGEMDVATLFGKQPDVERHLEDMSRYPAYGMVQRMPNPKTLVPGTAQFTPPQPSLLGPVIQDPESFAQFVFNERSAVQGVSAGGRSFQSQGAFSFEVKEVNMSYRPPVFQGNLNFNSIIRWERRTSGFDGAPKGELMLFDSIEYYFNVRPIAVPRIIIKGKLSDLLPSTGSGAADMSKLGDMMFSGIEIDLQLKSHDPLQ